MTIVLQFAVWYSDWPLTVHHSEPAIFATDYLAWAIKRDSGAQTVNDDRA